MGNILIIASNVHETLSAMQLARCVALVEKSDHQYQVDIIEAGVAEIPFVISTYHRIEPFDGYIALGLILKKDPEHVHAITSHLTHCFAHFALNDVAVGNGIVTGSTVEELSAKIESADPCQSAYPSALRAVAALIALRERCTRMAS